MENLGHIESKQFRQTILTAHEGRDVIIGTHSFDRLSGIDFFHLVCGDFLDFTFILGIHGVMDDVVSEIGNEHIRPLLLKL